jgi:hypothetical protein
MSLCKASEIPRNEAYREVRRSDLPCYIGYAVSQSENLTGRGMRVTQPFDASTLLSIDPELCRRVDFAQGHELVEWQMDVFQQPLLKHKASHANVHKYPHASHGGDE